MTGHIPPFPRPDPWLFTGRKYRIFHRNAAEFVGECVETHGSWATFKVIDGSPELGCKVYSVGELIDIGREGCRVEELA